MSMIIDDKLVEKTKESISNPKERMILERLYLLSQLYKGAEPQRVTKESVEESLKRIRAKLKSTDYTISQEGKKDLVNRLISVTSMIKGVNRRNTDTILHDLSFLENELLLPPSFPWYLEGLLGEKIKGYSEKQLSRGSRRWEN